MMGNGRNYIGIWSITFKITRTGYFLPSVCVKVAELVKCDRCQKFAKVAQRLAVEFTSVECDG